MNENVAKVYPYSLIPYKAFGFWCPLEWNRVWQKVLYGLYTLIAICLLVCGFVTQFMYIGLRYEHFMDTIDLAFQSLIEVTAFCKILTTLMKRSNMIALADILMNDYCIPKDAKELKIISRFDKIARRITILYVGAVQVLFSISILQTVFVFAWEKTLPFAGWFPFDHTRSIGYWVALIHQLYVYYILATMGPNYDCLVVGLMYKAYGQFHILKYRLIKITDEIVEDPDMKILEHDVKDTEQQALAKCVLHHHEIIKYTKLLNETFDGVLFIQSAVASVIVCMGIYQIASVKGVTIEFFYSLLLIIMLLSQMLTYCWHGNELTLESADIGNAVYAMDWTTLDIRTQKSLLIIMLRTLRPLMFTSGGIVTWNLDTFISLTKLSYSMYNLLDTTS